MKPISGWEKTVLAMTVLRFPIFRTKRPFKIFYKVMITGAIGETVDTKNTASLLYSREGIITETIERSVTIVKAAFTGGGNFLHKTVQGGSE